MKDLKQKLIIQQVDEKLQVFTPLLQAPPPPQGWIHTIRFAFNMSLRQFGDRLGLSINSVKHIEKREQEKSITLKSLESRRSSQYETCLWLCSYGWFNSKQHL